MPAAAPKTSGYERVIPAHDQHSTPEYLASGQEAVWLARIDPGRVQLLTQVAYTARTHTRVHVRLSWVLVLRSLSEGRLGHKR